MNSFELNKVLGAILGTCLILLALNIGAGALFAPEKPKKPGYAIAVKAGEGGEKKEAAQETPLPERLAKASVEKGQSTAKQCQACHTFEKGGPNRVGPNLYGIVGENRGEGRGFNFSSAMKAKGGKWTFDELDKFLSDPRGYISGTAMTFAGIKNDQQRADVIDYLHTLSDSPLPLPKPQANNALQGGGESQRPGGAPPANAPKK
ncbi:MAG TPA: cytochrome c family protein [Pseudolabrys sp.]|nr:cytochrome c family protein [Pseudolabrys sp.]